ncbi:hypothetical protein SLS54_008169 [Diplodia seriata]
MLLDSARENSTWASNTRIGKCTAFFGKMRPTYERARRSHDMHNRIHGITPLVLRQQLVEGLWNKPAFILSVILDELRKPKDERLEWLLWVDRDTIVLNPCVPVEAFLPPAEEEDVHMVVTKDWNGLNNGVFLVRVNEWAVELFSDILGFPYHRPDVELRFTEQSAMEKLLDEDKFRDNTVYVPQRWFNAYQGRDDEKLEPFQTRRGDFLVHFAGVGDRSKEMEYWLNIAEKHAPDWMLDFYRTAYPAETEEFWRNYADQE